MIIRFGHESALVGALKHHIETKFSAPVDLAALLTHTLIAFYFTETLLGPSVSSRSVSRSVQQKCMGCNRHQLELSRFRIRIKFCAAVSSNEGSASLGLPISGLGKPQV